MKKSIFLAIIPLYIACGSEQGHEHTAEGHEDAQEMVDEHAGHDHDHDHHGHDHDHDHHGHDHDHAQKEPGHYGASMTKDGAISPDKMVAMMESKEEMKCKLKAEVITSCQKKGCWMDVKMEDGSTMKVTFTDYGFFVPREGLGGKTAYMEGTAVREEISVDMLKHYAEDAGKSEDEIAAITEPETGLAFVADAVIIED